MCMKHDGKKAIPGLSFNAKSKIEVSCCVSSLQVRSRLVTPLLLMTRYPIMIVKTTRSDCASTMNAGVSVRKRRYQRNDSVPSSFVHNPHSRTIPKVRNEMAMHLHESPRVRMTCDVVLCMVMRRSRIQRSVRRELVCWETAQQESPRCSTLRFLPRSHLSEQSPWHDSVPLEYLESLL